MPYNGKSDESNRLYREYYKKSHEKNYNKTFIFNKTEEIEERISIYKEKCNFLELIEYLSLYSFKMNYFEDEGEKFKDYYYLLSYQNEEELEFLIKNVGPLYIEITTYDLNHYKSGIFNPFFCGNNDEMLWYEKLYDGHYSGVILIGYGKEGDYEYWIAKSFFGDNWGEKEGVFRILKNKGIQVFRPNNNLIALNMRFLKYLLP